MSAINRNLRVIASVAAIAVVGLANSDARAGNPCPIGVAVIDLGIPDWAKSELKAKVKDGDGFLAKMVRLADNQECSDVSMGKVAGGRVDVVIYEKVPAAKMTLAHIRGLMVDGKRRFQCSTAAHKLRYLSKTSNVSGMVLYYRGHRRILIANAGWKSVCLSAEKADKMSDAQIRALWNRVTKKMVDDRHANP